MPILSLKREYNQPFFCLADAATAAAAAAAADSHPPKKGGQNIGQARILHNPPGGDRRVGVREVRSQKSIRIWREILAMREKYSPYFLIISGDHQNPRGFELVTCRPEDERCTN